MTLTVPERSLVEHREAELLFREARQRRRRRWRNRISIALAVIISVASLTLVQGFWGPGSHPDRTRVQPPVGAVSGTGATLVFAYATLRIIDVDWGATRQLPLPAPLGGSSDLSMVRLGRAFVLNRGDRAWLYRPGVQRPPLDLGPSLRLLPGPSSNRAWIWSESCAVVNPVCPDANGTVRLIDAGGRSLGAPIALPVDANWFPTGQSLSSGIVLAVAYGPGPNGVEIWNPMSDSIVRSLPDNVFVASGDWIASSEEAGCLPRCSVAITDLKTGARRTIALPIGLNVSGPGAVSPDGSRLALLGNSEVVVVALRTDRAGILQGPGRDLSSSNGPPMISWSSTGWLFAAGIGRTEVWAWRPGLRTARVLPHVNLPAVHLDPPQFQLDDPSMMAL